SACRGPVFATPIRAPVVRCFCDRAGWPRDRIDEEFYPAHGFHPPACPTAETARSRPATHAPRTTLRAAGGRGLRWQPAPQRFAGSIGLPALALAAGLRLGGQ